ncbi:MAG: SRPBCC family protein [Bacteroidales bacterium]|nr:SRPBCC family protein [Candidatus Scybalocola fimicaballi]
MESYVSGVKAAQGSAEQVFKVLSDMNNIQRIKSRIEGKVQDLQTTTDTCSFSIPPFGSASLKIASREPNSTVVYESVNSPMAFKLWIQIKEVAPIQSAIRLTLKVDLNFMLKSMLGSKIEEGIDKVAEAIAKLPYSQIK